MTLNSEQSLIRADLVAANASTAIDMSLAGMVLRSAASTGSRSLSVRQRKALRNALNQVDMMRDVRAKGLLWVQVDDDLADGSTPAQVIAAAARQDEPGVEHRDWDEALDRLIAERDAISLEGELLTITESDSATRFAQWLTLVARNLVESATKADLNRTGETSLA